MPEASAEGLSLSSLPVAEMVKRITDGEVTPGELETVLQGQVHYTCLTLVATGSEVPPDSSRTNPLLYDPTAPKEIPIAKAMDSGAPVSSRGPGKNGIDRRTARPHGQPRTHLHVAPHKKG